MGVPGKIVRKNNVKVRDVDLDQVQLPDPVEKEIRQLLHRVFELEQQVAELTAQHTKEETTCKSTTP